MNLRRLCYRSCCFQFLSGFQMLPQHRDLVDYFLDFQFLSGFQWMRSCVSYPMVGRDLSIPFRIPEIRAKNYYYSTLSRSFNSFPDSRRGLAPSSGPGDQKSFNSFPDSSRACLAAPAARDQLLSIPFRIPGSGSASSASGCGVRSFNSFPDSRKTSRPSTPTTS